MHVHSSALLALPHISHVPKDGRRILLLPWYNHDTGEWHAYVVAGGKLTRLAITRPTSSLYYSNAPVSENDLEIPIATLIAQHLSFPVATDTLNKLVNDFNYLAAVYRKLEILENSALDESGAAFMVASEVEYLLVLTRAMYDLVNRILAGTLALLKNMDSNKPVVEQLPGSYARLVLNGDTPRTTDELESKYRLPNEIASIVAASAQTFRTIRGLRVAIEHHGQSPPIIFITEYGLGIDSSAPGWSELPVWKLHQTLPNRIGSVRGMAAFLGSEVLELCKAVAIGLSGMGKLPQAISTGNRVYLTNPLVERLQDLQQLIRAPWRRPPESADA